MTIFGKVILFLNILAAGAVVYFSTQSWAHRQNENTTALKYYLLIQGTRWESPPIPAPEDAKDDPAVPLGTEKDPFRMGPAHPVYSVRLSFLKAHFNGAEKGTFNTPDPANSRLGELKRVQAAVNVYVENLKTDEETLKYLAGSYTNLRFDPGILVQLADSYDEREGYRSLVRKPWDTEPASAEKTKANAQTAKLALKSKFDAALGTPNTAAYEEATKKMKEKSKIALDADAEVKLADERLKAASKAYREIADPLLEKVENFKNDENKEVYKKMMEAKKARDEAYEAYLSKIDARRDADRSLRESFASIPSAASDEPDRTRRGIQLMMVLDRGESWQRRIVLVFGMNDYLTALKDRTERHNVYPDRFRQTMEADTAEFVDFYERSKEVAIDRDRLLYRQKEITAALEAQMKASERDLAATKTLNAAAVAALTAIDADIAARITAQSKVEVNLFDIEKQIGDLLRLNYELEDKLDVTEKKILGGK